MLFVLKNEKYMDPKIDTQELNQILKNMNLNQEDMNYCSKNIKDETYYDENIQITPIFTNNKKIISYILQT